MSQLPPQGFALPQSGVEGFPQAPALSRDNPGQLVPARPGFLPGALPGRGGDGAHQSAKLGRGTVPASGAVQANLSNGLPFGMGGPPPAPGPPAEGRSTSADMQAAAMYSAATQSAAMQAAAMQVDAAAMQAAAMQSAAMQSAAMQSAAMQSAAMQSAAMQSAMQSAAAQQSAAAMHPGASTPAQSESAPPLILAGFAPAAPPSGATPPPPAMLSGFAPAAPPQASQPPLTFGQVVPPPGMVSSPPGMVSAAPGMVSAAPGMVSAAPGMVSAPPAIISAPPAGVSSPPMVTPAMGGAAVGMPSESSARDHGVEPPARIGQDPSRSHGALGSNAGEVAIAVAPGETNGAVSPWMFEKSAPPPPVFTPSTPVEVAKPVAPPKPTSKAPFMAVFALLVIGGIAFTAYHFRAQLAFEGGSKKTDEGALKVAAPTETSAPSSEDKTPSTPMSARPPPQLATGMAPPPLPPSTGAANPLPGPKPGPAKPPPTSTPVPGGKFDPQGI